MKNYFDALDRLCESGQPSKSEAISALQGKFPELSANAERAGRIVTAWRSGFGKTHVPQEGYASSEEAEALFLFGDFLRDLASNLACRNSAEKCALCVFTNTPACERMAPPCYNGVEQYLLKRAAAYIIANDFCQNFGTVNLTSYGSGSIVVCDVGWVPRQQKTNNLTDWRIATLLKRRIYKI